MNYDKFHQRPKIQKKIINNNNFTYRYLISLINNLKLHKEAKILDYGCGVGTVDFFLARKGFLVTGLEVSKIAIQVSKESSKAIGVEKRVKFFNISTRLNAKFDLIICSEVIEHVPDYLKLLRKLKKHMKNTSYMIITTPSINAPLFRMRLLKNFDNKVGHLRRYDAKSLIKELDRIGLKTITMYKREGILRNSLFTISKLNWIVKFLKGPLSDLVTFMDEILLKIFGESNIQIIVKKS